MNYNSVQEILDAGISNMTVLRNYNKNDDGSDSITGASWLEFNGQTINTLYANGNSYIGMGQKAEHLKVNRVDGAMYYLYREEGTLYNFYKFIKIRWVGYSSHRYTYSSYELSYDIIFWDTGDISLHMNKIPTSNIGTYSLTTSSQTYNYNVSIASPDVTFQKKENNFTIVNSLIDIQIPGRKYLIYDNNKYYTILNNTLSEIIDVSELTADIFQNYGVDKFPKDSALYNSLSNPKILFWAESDVAKPQTNNIVIEPKGGATVYYESKDVSNLSGIKVAKIIASDDVLFALSFDNGARWGYIDTDGYWTLASTNTEGMTAFQVYRINAERWSDIFQPTTLKIRAYLPNEDSYFSSFYFFPLDE